MSKEIKEILQVLDKHGILSGEQDIFLLDYITNLQQQIKEYQQDYERLYIEDCKLRENHNIDDISLLDENYKLQQDLEKANEIIEKDRQFYKCRIDENIKLREENERLKEENKHIFSKVNDDELLISNAMNYAEAQDYKSRNEKAIEYITNRFDEDKGIWIIDCYDLLDILNGSDDK